MSEKTKRSTHDADAPETAPQKSKVAQPRTADLEDMINRAFNRPMSSGEEAFVAVTRTRVEAGEELSEFDLNWLKELAER